jgi:hypothetical protein
MQGPREIKVSGRSEGIEKMPVKAASQLKGTVNE